MLFKKHFLDSVPSEAITASVNCKVTLNDDGQADMAYIAILRRRISDLKAREVTLEREMEGSTGAQNRLEYDNGELRAKIKALEAMPLLSPTEALEAANYTRQIAVLTKEVSNAHAALLLANENNAARIKENHALMDELSAQTAFHADNLTMLEGLKAAIASDTDLHEVIRGLREQVRVQKAEIIEMTTQLNVEPVRFLAERAVDLRMLDMLRDELVKALVELENRPAAKKT